MESASSIRTVFFVPKLFAFQPEPDQQVRRHPNRFHSLFVHSKPGSRFFCVHLRLNSAHKSQVDQTIVTTIQYCVDLDNWCGYLTNYFLMCFCRFLCVVANFVKCPSGWHISQNITFNSTVGSFGKYDLFKIKYIPLATVSSKDLRSVSVGVPNENTTSPAARTFPPNASKAFG